MKSPRIEPHPDKNEISFHFNPRLYHHEALYGTALVFSNRCFVYLDGDGKKTMTVTLQGKSPLGEAGLSGLVGEFHNELLSQTLRWMVAKHNKKTRDAIITQALWSAKKLPQPGFPLKVSRNGAKK